MKPFLLALLPFASQADYPGQFCFTGTIKIGNDTWTQDHIMASLEPLVTSAVIEVANGDPKLSKFLQTQGNCQADCLAIVMRPTFMALYGKLGEEFVSQDEKHKHHDVFVDAISGAFQACYPHPPREEVKKVAETIFAATFEGMGAGAASSNLFPAGVQCPNEGYEDVFPLNDFLASFHVTILEVMTKKPKLQKLFESQSKDCQKTCLQNTVPASALSLFQTNNYEYEIGIDALTGAIHACLPDWPHAEINVLVAETSDVMARVEAEATEEAHRQYADQQARAQRAARVQAQAAERQAASMFKGNGNYPRQQVDRRRRAPGKKKAAKMPEPEPEPEDEQPSDSSSFWPTFGFVVALTMTLCVGMALGRKYERNGSKSYEMLPSVTKSSFDQIATSFGRVHHSD